MFLIWRLLLTVVVYVLVVGDALLIPHPRTVHADGLAAAVSGGGTHSCALTTTGGAKCWGDNSYGQLGDGTNFLRLTPVDVVGLGSGVAAMSSGGAHTCALTKAGGVKCWGINLYGQLGNFISPSTDTPVDVIGLTAAVSAISAGGLHTCALTAAGGVKCWGANGQGELGDGQACGTICLVPVDVSGLASGVAAISAGGSHTCALTTGGAVKCWGSNHQDQVGDGIGGGNHLTPVTVSGLTSGVASISTGFQHSCAITEGAALKCWGRNNRGQLGDGSKIDSPVPVDVSGLSSGIAAVSGGIGHTCALSIGGEVKCWGDNSLGQVGDDQACGTLVCTTPVAVSSLGSGVGVISAGFYHTCAVTSVASVKCWGYNQYGKMGDGTFDNNRYTLVDVTGFGPGPEPKPTPTNAPEPVGGFSVDLGGSDGSLTPPARQASASRSTGLVAAIAGGAVGASFALGAACWLAWRRVR